MSNSGAPVLSIVATIYNSAPMVLPLVERLNASIESLGILFEIILVDDASLDNSLQELEKVAIKDRRVKVVSLSRNYGQQVAMSSGIYHVSGDYVVIMDGDLQNPPEMVPKLYEELLKGCDIVYTSSKSRNNAWDGFTSKLFWLAMEKFFGVGIVKSQLMMRGMTAECAEMYKHYPERIRTVAAITHDIGMNVTELKVENEKRAFGKSNYNTMKRINLAIDVILDMSNNPLNLVFYLGLIVLLITLGSSLFYIYSYLMRDVEPGFTTLVLLTMFFGSINLISIGVIARYVSNIYSEVKGRPLFHVKKKINF